MTKLDHQSIRKILIRSTNWIGDAVMTTPAMAAVRASFPNAEIVVTANPMVSEIFKPHPSCDRVIVFDKKGKDRGLRGLARFAAGLRRESFDLAILFQNAMEAALMAYLAGIPRRLGYRRDMRGMLLTHGVSCGRHERQLHHTDYYLHLLRAYGIEGGDGALYLTSTDAERDWASEVLKQTSWIAINPGASYGSAKRWFPDRFAAVADVLAKQYAAGIVITGGPSELDLGNDIEAAMQGACLNLVGRTTVRQMMAVLSRCRLMVTNDSGPMHVAAALGVPVVALFGPTDHTTTSPLAPMHRVVRKETDCAPCLKRACPTDHRCMTAIDVDDVLKAARQLLDP
ncbi:MAG: lipopolysaccharide heptosyltransferase II [Syntrophobacteraceae bacterium]